MTVDEIKSQWAWRPIPRCPGRFLLLANASSIAPGDLLASTAEVTEHRVPAAVDPVLVAPLDDGGLISYRKPNGTYVHTLNTPDGFARKLQQLGIG